MKLLVQAVIRIILMTRMTGQSGWTAGNVMPLLTPRRRHTNPAGTKTSYYHVILMGGSHVQPGLLLKKTVLKCIMQTVLCLRLLKMTTNAPAVEERTHKGARLSTSLSNNTDKSSRQAVTSNDAAQRNPIDT